MWSQATPRLQGTSGCIGKPKPAPERGKKIKLPQSSSRRSLPYVFLTVVERILPQPGGLYAYDGKLYRPGGVIDLETLPRPAVAIECAGPVGAHRKGKRHQPYEYILWLLVDDFK
jgi:hypothetical protein